VKVAASTFQAETFKEGLAAIPNDEKKAEYLKTETEQLHAICELTLKQINEPARRLMLMNNSNVFVCVLFRFSGSRIVCVCSKERALETAEISTRPLIEEVE